MPTSENTTHRPLIVVVGPTAGGKTSLSVQLALALGDAVCLSADSMQIYEGMDIGTATPTLDERCGVEHRMLSMVSPSTPYSVDDWLHAAESAIADIRTRGQWPIVVGGTNLYVQALLFGLVDGPPPQLELRAQLAEWASTDLHKRLATVDPEAAARIHPNDRRRTIRAIEVAQATGTPLTDQQGHWSGTCRPDAVVIGLSWPTEEINQRINARVKLMMDDGLLDEVRALHEAGLLGEQAAAAVGYRQLIEHLEGQCDLDAAIEQIKIRSRRLGKQQRTWLRRFQALPQISWLDPTQNNTEILVEQSVAHIQACGFSLD